MSVRRGEGVPPIMGVTQLGPWAAIDVEDARDQLPELLQRVADGAFGDDGVALTRDGRILAVLVDPEKIEDIREERSLLQSELDRVRGVDNAVSMKQLIAELGAA
ncbi:hypothetical protein ACWGIB_24260 [Streptomyces xiamenensis]